MSKQKTKRFSRHRYPEKRGINLLYRDDHTLENLFSVFLFLIFMGFLVFFSHYFVALPLQRADEAEAKYARTERELESLREENSIYARVRAEYSHYGNGYLNEAERARQDRITMLNVIDKRVGSFGGIQTISISDNIANLTMELTDADQLPTILSSLEESEYVSYVTASTAATVDRNGSITSDRIDPEMYSYITAQITIYFRTEAEVKTAVGSGLPAYDTELDAQEGAVQENAYVPSIAVRESQPEESTAAAGSGSTGSRSVSSSSGSRSSSSGSSSSVPETAAASTEGSSTSGGSSRSTNVTSPTIATRSANIQTPSEASEEITSLNNGYNPR